MSIPKFDRPLIFFDGECMLCNGFVRFLLRQGADKIFFFTSLQGRTAVLVLSEKERTALDTVILWANGRMYKESNAVLEVLLRLGGVWKMISVFRLVPPFFRDGLYRLVSRVRYRVWGQQEHCEISSKAYKQAFLE